MYWYWRGINLKAILALLPAVAIGMLLILIDSVQFLASFSWFIGAAIAALTSGCLMCFKVNRSTDRAYPASPILPD